MGKIQEITESINESTALAKDIAQMAAPNAWSRITLMACIGAIVMGSYLAALTFLVRDYGNKSEDFIAEFQLLSKENLDQRALDYIQLCIDADKSNDPNKEYYCGDAVAFYKDTFIDFPNSKVEKNIKLSAYGAMKVDIATRMRSTALQRFDLKTPRMSETLRFMLSWGIGIICVVGILAMLGTAYTTYRIARSLRS